MSVDAIIIISSRYICKQNEDFLYINLKIEQFVLNYLLIYLYIYINININVYYIFIQNIYECVYNAFNCIF